MTRAGVLVPSSYKVVADEPKYEFGERRGAVRGNYVDHETYPKKLPCGGQCQLSFAAPTAVV